eukprot:3647171-Amphidinium_carterae.1
MVAMVSSGFVFVSAFKSQFNTAAVPLVMLVLFFVITAAVDSQHSGHSTLFRNRSTSSPYTNCMPEFGFRMNQGVGCVKTLHRS